MLRGEVDDLMEPEGDEAPAEAGGEEDALGAESVAEVASQDLRECVSPEEGAEASTSSSVLFFSFYSAGQEERKII